MITEQRQKFFGALAKLVQPDDSEGAARSLAPIMAMVDDVPEFAFASRECLNRVASAKRRTIVPAYADIRSAMLSWVQNQPREALPGLEDEQGLDGMDLSWYRYFRARQAEGFKPLRHGRPSSREHVLSLVLAQSRPAWERITGVRPAWRDVPSQEERDGVRRAAREAREAMAAVAEPWTPSVADQRRGMGSGS
jgi:hypothetical protein